MRTKTSLNWLYGAVRPPPAEEQMREAEIYYYKCICFKLEYICVIFSTLYSK